MSKTKPEEKPPFKASRGDMKREFKEMIRSIYNNLYWNPEEDIAIIIARYNLDVDRIKEKVLELLSL